MLGERQKKVVGGGEKVVDGRARHYPQASPVSAFVCVWEVVCVCACVYARTCTREGRSFAAVCAVPCSVEHICNDSR